MPSAVPPALLRNLLLRAEIPRLAAAFEKPPAIPLVVFKGLALTEQLGRPLAARHILDIDLLVEPRRMLELYERLDGLGYSTGQPPRLPGAGGDWQASFVRRHQDMRLELDVHWRLLSPWLFSRDPNWETSTRKLKIDRTQLLTLNPEWTVLQLAAHWVQHQATEPHILADFIAACRTLPVNWTRLRAEAEPLGLTRAVDFTIACAGGALAGLPRPVLDRGTAFFGTFFPPSDAAERPSLRRHLASQLLGDRRQVLARLFRFAVPAPADFSRITGRPLDRAMYWQYPVRLTRGLKRLVAGSPPSQRR